MEWQGLRAPARWLPLGRGSRRKGEKVMRERAERGKEAHQKGAGDEVAALIPKETNRDDVYQGNAMGVHFPHRKDVVGP